MDDAAELERCLTELVRAGSFEVYEDGRRLPETEGLRFQVRTQGRRTRLHLWSENRSLVRTVVRVAVQSGERLLLEVERFGQSRPGRLEFVATGSRFGRAGRARRGAFLERFRQLLTGQFPDERIESLSAVPDLEHSFSRCYVRGLLTRAQEAWAVMAAGEEEEPATVNAMLAFALIWLDWKRSRARRKTVRGIRLFVPEEKGAALLHRIGGLAPEIRRRQVEVYELPSGKGMWRARRLDPADAGNIATWLTPRREVEATLTAAEAFVGRARALAPEAVDAVVPPGTREVTLRFRGLDFARWRDGQAEFGVGRNRRKLDDRGWERLRQLVRQLERHRQAEAADRRHPLYRAQPERWLESLLWSDPTRVDPLLLPEHVHAQVAVFSAGDRGVIDLLGARRDGRLVVIELKADEDLQLPIQAVDYWLRVRRHLEQDDFRRYGYFSGVELVRQPPVLYLVAPGLRFHPTTGTLLSYLDPEIPIHRIGVNEDWRAGLRVVERM
jgi:hypothetical protein